MKDNWVPDVNWQTLVLALPAAFTVWYVNVSEPVPLLSDADTQLVGKLGVISQGNQADLKTAETMRKHAQEDWQSTSGVNQDEEAINLVEYQNMYQANMKVMTVANALFDATLAMMG